MRACCGEVVLFSLAVGDDVDDGDDGDGYSDSEGDV